jgi:hypothetical protein
VHEAVLERVDRQAPEGDASQNSLFEEGNAAMARAIVAQSESVLHAQREADLPLLLADLSYLRLWQRVAGALTELQGNSRQACLPSWRLAKQEAQHFLNIRSDISTMFDEVRQELQSRNLRNVSEGIRATLMALEGFLPVYNLQSLATSGDAGVPEPLYEPPRRNNPGATFDAYPTMRRNVGIYSPIPKDEIFLTVQIA